MQYPSIELPGWQIVSGSGRYEKTSGQGREYSGSGTQTIAVATYSVGGVSGTYNYTATATQSGKTENSSGIFVETAVQSGSWAVTLRRCRTFWKKAFENSALLVESMVRREFL